MSNLKNVAYSLGINELVKVCTLAEEEAMGLKLKSLTEAKEVTEENKVDIDIETLFTEDVKDIILKQRYMRFSCYQFDYSATKTKNLIRHREAHHGRVRYSVTNVHTKQIIKEILKGT